MLTSNGSDWRKLTYLTREQLSYISYPIYFRIPYLKAIEVITRAVCSVWKAINTHRTDVTENPQIDDVILKIFVLHMYLSTAFGKLN